MKKFAYQLYACGRRGFPDRITMRSADYQLQKVLKHDFFAATAIYELAPVSGQPQWEAPPKIILKISRQEHFLGLPLTWLGRLICNHEISILDRLSHLDRVPHLLSRYETTGFTYTYIEGSALNDVTVVPDDFFDRALDLLKQIHNCDVIYLDMNKRSNIIVGPDGLPYIIDFQISLYINKYTLLFPFLSRRLRDFLRDADIYHMLKHKRRICPRLLRPEEEILSRRTGVLMRLHRAVATPLRKLRRAFLNHLRRKGVITEEKRM